MNSLPTVATLKGALQRTCVGVDVTLREGENEVLALKTAGIKLGGITILKVVLMCWAAFLFCERHWQKECV